MDQLEWYKLIQEIYLHDVSHVYKLDFAVYHEFPCHLNHLWLFVDIGMHVHISKEKNN